MNLPCRLPGRNVPPFTAFSSLKSSVFDRESSSVETVVKMMQYFHWYTPADGTLWRMLTQEASTPAEAGITSVWLPPAYKGAEGAQDRGYNVYDFFDLGEFDQKGSRTKYGTREEYLQAIKAAQTVGMQVYANIVLNHKMGGDEVEEFKATPYNPDNRNEAIGE